MEKLTDTIDRYLDGQMTAEEKTAFEAKMKTDTSLSGQVDVQRQLRAGIERLGMKTAVSSTFRKMTLKNKIYKWGVTTVAVVAVGTAVYFGYNATQNTPGERVTTNELPALNENGKAEWADADRNLPTQLFTIDPSRDTVIETMDGIVFAIPAGAFLNAKAPVTLEIREALSALDIMKGGLSTMSDDQPLETGGMFYLNARNGNTSLKINPQKPVYANVPANEIKPGMMLFDGERTKDGGINWKNPKQLEKQLLPVDIHALDFYPEGFCEKVAELGFNANDKEITDSIYYSYAGRKTLPGYYIESRSSYRGTADGRALFKANCSACHKASEERSTGPGLQGALERIPAGSWKYDWVHNSSAVIASGDAYAVTKFREYNSTPMTAFPALSNEDIDAILDFADKGGAPYEIDPARIAAIWNDKFQNTILATREFEERLQLIFHCGQPAIIDLYVNNLDKKMYEIDSMAMRLNPAFRQFYLRHDGGISITQSHMLELQTYFERKRKAVEQAAAETYEKRIDDEQAKDRAHLESQTDRIQANNKAYLENLRKEFEINLKEAYRQLDIRAAQPPPPAYYSFNFTITGWHNVDRAVYQSTITRTTLDYTDSVTGKKAVIRYEEWSVNIPDAKAYEQLQVYLVADSLPCYMKVKGENGVYTEKLNELMHYSLVVVAQKGKSWYWCRRDNVNPGTMKVQLEGIAESQLRVNLDASFGTSIGSDFGKELDALIEEHFYRQNLKAREQQAEIDKQIMELIFNLNLKAQPPTESIGQ